jgi:hypothetical protein
MIENIDLVQELIGFLWFFSVYPSQSQGLASQPVKDTALSKIPLSGRVGEADNKKFIRSTGPLNLAGVAYNYD